MALGFTTADQSPKEFPPLVVAITGLPVMPNGLTTKWMMRFTTAAGANAWTTQVLAIARGGLTTVQVAQDVGFVYEATLSGLPQVIGGSKVFCQFPDQASCDAWVAQVNPLLAAL